MKTVRVLLVYAHPNPKSFCNALKDAAAERLQSQGAQVRIKDLYAEEFNPVLTGAEIARTRAGEISADIKKEQADLLWSTHLILIYPIWWVDRPAILKGWFDRVFLYGFAHKGAKGGLLEHEKALVLQTAGEPENFYRRDGRIPPFHPTITEGTLHYCGIDDVTVETFYGVPGLSEDLRKEMLQAVSDLVAEWGK